MTNAIPWNNAQAVSEGWDLFDLALCIGSSQWAICRDDEAGEFRDDREAIAFVLNSAMEGSAYHRDALSIHLGCETLKA